MENKLLNQIITRHKAENKDSYIGIEGFDDRKKQGSFHRSKFFKLSETTPEIIEQQAKEYNSGTYGVYLNINPIFKPRRIKDNVKKILFVFVDLDDANEDHNKLVKIGLQKLNITYSYNAKSGHGYHFLIPINLETTNEPKIKGFLSYLKKHYCDKVDLATADNTRLLRFPNSIHNKDDEPKQLITLHTHTPKEDEILNNNKNISDYQIEQFKGKKDIEYESSINKEDIFFSTIFSSVLDLSKAQSNLNKSKDRNNNFIKNLAVWGRDNPKKETSIIQFLSEWEPSRVQAYKGWKVKSQENKYNINYLELLKWCKDNKLNDWSLLLKQQVQNSFLDDYEFYYLEEEKTENAYLMYYPEKNYFVQKSLNEILNNIYYDCKEKGIDLTSEFGLDVIKDWEDFSFKKQIGIILSSIHKRLDTQNRIKLIYNINYEPSDEKFIHLDKKKFFNTYNKSELWDYTTNKKSHNFPKIKELMMNLTGQNENNYNYLNNWLSWQIKNPLEKLPTAIILQGRQGSGKGTFSNLILNRIFGNNAQEINQTNLESSFNEYLLGKQIIVANEVMHNENRQTLPNVLKNLVTDPYITINRKFRKELVCRNFTHWIFCTNNDNPIKIDEDDRRYSVFYSKKLPKKLGKELRDNLDFEIKEYISYLRYLNPIFEEVSEPIMTDAKQDIIELNKDSIQRFVEHMKIYKNYDAAVISICENDKHKEIYHNQEDGNFYTHIESFYMLYRKWAETTKETGIYNKQNFGRKMSNYSIINSVKRINNTMIRVYNVFDIEKIIMS